MRKKLPPQEFGTQCFLPKPLKTMHYFSAILSGIVGWTLVVTSFIFIETIPAFKDAVWQQGMIILPLISLYAILGAWLYYRKDYKTHGLHLGIVMTISALVLDVLITVPFVEIPKGGSCQSFFTHPVLWLLAGVNVGTVYLYWLFKIVRTKTT